MKKNTITKMVFSAMFLSIAIILPFFTGQIKQIGNALCPMHIPVMLCGYLCGPIYGLIIGFVAPYLRFLKFGMPLLMPSGIAMSLELATYGFMCGLLYRIFLHNKWRIYLSLFSAMIAGRAVWGIARTVLAGMTSSEFGWTVFLSGAVLSAIPGILLQIIFVPILVKVCEKNKSLY